MTRLGDLLHYGQLFKARGNNYFTQIAHILDHFCKGGKIFHFSTESIYWATFIDIWRFLLVTLLGADFLKFVYFHFSDRGH